MRKINALGTTLCSFVNSLAGHEPILEWICHIGSIMDWMRLRGRIRQLNRSDCASTGLERKSMRAVCRSTISDFII